MKNLNSTGEQECLWILTSASSLINFVPICFGARAFKCLSIILKIFHQHGQIHKSWYINYACKPMYGVHVYGSNILNRGFTCSDRTPYGRSGKSLSHFQWLLPRNPLHLSPCILHVLSFARLVASQLLSIEIIFLPWMTNSEISTQRPKLATKSHSSSPRG